MLGTEGWPKPKENKFKGLDKHVIGPISGMDALEEIRRQGACAKLSPERADLFFSKRKTDTEYAKRVCGTCVVLLACKEAAIKISTKDIKGVLGGLSERERNKMQKEKEPTKI